MNSQLMQNTLSVLTNLEQLEKTVARLYEFAAQQWPSDADLWNSMAGDEIKHAEYIKTLAAMLAKDPDNFTINRPINIVAINTSLSWIDKNIADIKNGTFNIGKMLFLARDIEQSILESKYSEFLKTNDIEYNELVKLIIRETVGHKKMIDDRISNLKK